jgi:3-phenylpropionate/cinnamic acid dioxygenase small subunit
VPGLPAGDLESFDAWASRSRSQKATLTLVTERYDSALARVVAELEIRNVIARLAQLADSGDIDEYLSLFTEDAVWDMPDNPRAGMPQSTREGRAAIGEGAYERRAAAEKTPGISRMHFVGTTAVEIAPDGDGDGDGDGATATSYFLFIVSDATQSKIQVLGTYYDTLRRVGDAWKLARRNMVFG